MAPGMTHTLIEVSSGGKNYIRLGYYASSLKSRNAPRMSPLRRADNRANFMSQSARNWDPPPPGAQRVCPGLYRGCNWYYSSVSGHLG
jgi:hypothetical protein